MKGKQSLDALDHAILALLSQDARISNRRIAAEVGVSEGTVRLRMQRLEDAGIMRVTAVTHIRSLPHPVSRSTATGGARWPRHCARCPSFVA